MIFVIVYSHIRSHGTTCRLSGNRNDLIAFHLSNLLLVEPAAGATWSRTITPEPKIKPPKRAVEFLVGAAGFEPTLAESESDVLPLNYAPINFSDAIIVS